MACKQSELSSQVITITKKVISNAYCDLKKPGTG